MLLNCTKNHWTFPWTMLFFSAVFSVFCFISYLEKCKKKYCFTTQKSNNKNMEINMKRISLLSTKKYFSKLSFNSFKANFKRFSSFHFNSSVFDFCWILMRVFFSVITVVFGDAADFEEKTRKSWIWKNLSAENDSKCSQRNFLRTGIRKDQGNRTNLQVPLVTINQNWSLYINQQVCL